MEWPNLLLALLLTSAAYLLGKYTERRDWNRLVRFDAIPPPPGHARRRVPSDGVVVLWETCKRSDLRAGDVCQLPVSDFWNPQLYRVRASNGRRDGHELYLECVES